MFKIFFKSQIARKTILSFLLKIFQALFSFTTTVLLARMLGAKGYGIYAYAFAFVTLFSIPVQIGLSQLIIRETAKGIAKKRPEVIKGIWYWAIRIGIFSSLVLLICIGTIFAFLKRNEFGLEETFFWALLLVPIFIFSNIWGASLRGLHKIITGQLPEFIIRPGLFLIFLCIINFIFHKNLTPSQAMVLQVAAAVIALIIGGGLFFRNIPSFVYSACPSYEGNKWFNSLLPLTFVAGMWMINSHIDIVILGIFKSPFEVGIYRIASQLALLSSFALQAVNIVIAPHIAGLYAKREMDKLQHLATRSARTVLTFNLLVAIFFLSFGKIFINLLFGKEFVWAYIPLLILLGGQLINSATGSVGFLLNMTGHERDSSWGMTLAAGINIVLNFFLIPLLGAKGAAIATAVSMITWNIVIWWLVRKRLGINSLAFSLSN